MKQYLDLLRHVRDNGTEKTDRTGTGTRSVFGYQMRFDLKEGFPLVTTKKVYFKGLAVEMLWLLKGSTNIKYLVDNNVHIWDAWAEENGDLGPVYGKQWVNWQKPDGGFVNQIQNVVESIKKKSGLASSHRKRLECWGDRADGTPALPHVFPILGSTGRRRRARQAELPALRPLQ